MNAANLPTERVLLPDLLRAFALMGIVLVNVMGFSWPMTEGYHMGGIVTQADAAADIGVLGLFMAKSYPLFSMMFGAGLAFQIASAERAGANFKPRYYRRMAALMALGILHFIFFWMGDILMTYAVLGSALLWVKNLPVKALIILGALLIFGNALMLGMLGGLMVLGESFAPDEMLLAAEEMSVMSKGYITAFGDGNFWQAALFRLTQLPTTFFGVLFQQGISVFGFFCFGLAAVKAGAITNASYPIWKRSRLVFLPIGLIFSFIGAWLFHNQPSMVTSGTMFGLAIIFAASPFSALGYAGLIAKASQGEPGPIRRFFARAGSASLTAYLIQSFVLSWVFSAYGLDLFAKLGAAQAIAIAAAAGLFSLAFTGIWCGFFKRGPFEYWLRRFTYWGPA
jgi:uncharacterized protein